MGKAVQESDKKEKVFKFLLYSGDILRMLSRVLKYALLFIFSLASVLFFLLFAYYVGFEHTPEELTQLRAIFRGTLIFLFLSKFILGIYEYRPEKIRSALARGAILILCMLIILSNSVFKTGGGGLWEVFRGTGLVIGAGFLISLLEVYRLTAAISSVNFTPSLVFSERQKCKG